MIVFIPPETNETQRFMNTTGADTDGWKRVGVEGRRRWVQSVVTAMLYNDNIELDVIQDALCQVDEWAQFPFSTDHPPPKDA